MNELFQEDLLKDEKILWTGQPETTVLFTGADVFLVPFSGFANKVRFANKVLILLIKSKCSA